ncbi:MAG: alpha-glucosidase [Pedosphaera sp.]|nr:alpha-glucosidase [Pedosphaera sp.]
MSKFTGATVRPIGRLKVVNIDSKSALMQSSRATLQITVLADNLIRLRIARGKSFSGRPSWAVDKTDWPSTSAQINQTGNQLGVRTTKGALTLDLETTRWMLTDVAGNNLFAAPDGMTGFQGTKAGATLNLSENESIFGLGETTGTFNKRGQMKELWNIDVLGHAKAIYPGLRSLYVSIPFVVSLQNGRAAGLFWDNPARQLWDIGQTKLDQLQITAASGEVDLYLFIGPNIAEVVNRFTELTGRMPLPPLWSLGYQQCRYSYETRERVEEIAKTLRAKKIPCDVLYLDIHHMDGYRVFTFGKTFPKPAQMISKLARQGFKVVNIVDPGVKVDSKFGVYQRGRTKNAFVKNPTGTKDYVGRVWPGKACYPDFLNARVRRWWGQEQNKLLALGVAGLWNDMNEPANFALPTKTLPEDCPHHTDNGPMLHNEAHNLYGMQMARASREGALNHRPNERPFVITRAGYAGVQRYAMVWTGDNSSVWEHLNDSIQMLLNLSLSGLPFCGGDVGGFVGNTTPELFVRWMQLAALTPFFRNHTDIRTIDQEPWAFGSKVETICRQYIELRYQLLPYLYSLFVEAHRHGTPIMRPLFWHYQDDPIATAAGDQFMVGEHLLVAPITQQGAIARSVYLPEGKWYDFWTGQQHAGKRHVLANAPIESLPLYVRAGAIIPMIALQQFVGEKPIATINLHLWPGTEGLLNWHEDDGTTMNYTTGDTHERLITSSVNQNSGRIQFSPASGNRKSSIKKWRIILRGVSKRFQARVNDQPVATHYDKLTKICSFELRNIPSAIEIVLK